jgi:phthalate 4,5-dioxygenase oxygenase subunit
MLTREENALLTRTGPGTPMGALMRRYWLPALLSEELPEPGGDPKRVRLLGEDLVAYRAADGRVGLLAEYCPHRGASLAYARSEDCGLRCIYHGWKIGVDGTLLETPPEPPESTFRNRLRHVAYATHEAAGLIWAYMGPPERQPPAPRFPWTEAPAPSRVVTKVLQDCNWAQGVEGSIDSSHSDYLHSSNIRGRPSDHAPRLETQDTAYGFRYAAIRKPDAEPDRQKYVRVTLFVAPFYVFTPPLRMGSSSSAAPGQDVRVQQAWVPIDDEHNYFFSLRFNRNGPLVDNHRDQFQMDAAFRPRRHRANQHLQDRAAMRRGSWTGIEGVNSQDFAVVESMGPIVDRSKEHLGVSDVAVIRMRRRMLDAVRAFQAGAPPLGLDPAIPTERLATDERIVPIDTPWQAVAAFAGEEVPAVPA